MNFLQRTFQILALALLICGSATPVNAQVKSQTAEEQLKEQEKAKAARAKKIDSEMQAKKDHHSAIQTKKTRKRMKRNKRKNQRIRSGKSEPFFKRWFRKRHFK